MFLNPGVAIKNTTQSEYRLNNGFFLQSTDVKDDTSRLIELELNFAPLEYFSLSGVFIGLPYRTPGDAGPDRHFELAALPRIQSGRQGVVAWAGVAFGIRWLTLGTPSRASPGLTYTLVSPDPLATVTPHFGVDFILEGYTFGFSAARAKETRSLQGTAIDTGTGISSAVNVTQVRSWWTVQARFGFQL